MLVACNYFDVLRLRPAIGPGFTSANCDVPNAPPTVVLSHALWRHAFAADPDIVHKTITLNGLDVAVVGIAPEGFDGTELARAMFFGPLSLQPAIHPERNFVNDPQVSWLTLLARRHADTSIGQVRAELTVVASQIDRQQPGRSTTLLIAPATSLSLPVARRDFASVAVMVVAAFGLILLIACANVANVLLARGEARSREIAVRLAIGARRGRLVRLLLTESAVIALIGGVAGYTVTRRRREVGIRMALGASPRAVQALVLRETLRPVGVGVLLGVLAAASSQLLERGLFGISPFDPVAFAAAAIFMLTVATMATVLPTRNALKVDPVEALRHD